MLFELSAEMFYVLVAAVLGDDLYGDRAVL